MGARALFRGRKGDSPITKNLIIIIIIIIFAIIVVAKVISILSKMLVIES